MAFEQVKELYKSFDSDKNGGIDQNEMKAAFKGVRQCHSILRIQEKIAYWKSMVSMRLNPHTVTNEFVATQVHLQTSTLS